MNSQKLYIVGCGILGKQVAKTYSGESLGIVRSEQSLNALKHENIACSTKIPNDITTQNVLFCANGSPNQIEAVNDFVKQNPNFEGMAILISSTSYYQGTQGYIDENSPSGTTQRAIQCKNLEELFQDNFKRGWILRCGGLFQEGRGPFSYLAKTQQIPSLPTGQQLALFSYRDLVRLVNHLFGRSANEMGILLCTLSNCPIRFEYYKAAFQKLEIPFHLEESPCAGPQYKPDKLLSQFELVDKHWFSALI